MTARELNTGRQVQAVMSAKEGPTAARRKLDDGVAKGATGSFPVATTRRRRTGAPRAKARRRRSARFFRKLLGRPEAR